MKKKIRIFETYHPFSLFTYFISMLVISMFTVHPVMLLIALLAGITFYICIANVKEFFWGLLFQIPFFILIALTNPLFSHNGATPLFFMNGNAVTLEAILYGVDIALMIIVVIYWCKCYSIIVDSEKFIYLFGKAIPKLSMVLSMALKFIPMFKKQMKKISKAQKTLGYYSNDNMVDRLRNMMRVFSCMVTWSLEHAIALSKSMNGKGYGLKGRTHFHNFRFRRKDSVLLLVTIIMDVVVVSMMMIGISVFRFYPMISEIKYDTGNIIIYAAFAIMAFTPAFLEIKENLKWKYYVERI